MNVVCSPCQVSAAYYTALESVIKQETGATRVHVFDHTIREGSIRNFRYAFRRLLCNAQALIPFSPNVQLWEQSLTRAACSKMLGGDNLRAGVEQSMLDDSALDKLSQS